MPEETIEQPEDYQHRGVDEHGNGDDKFTEREALQMAADEGIYFVDSFHLGKVGTFSERLPEDYESKQEAEAARLDLDKPDDYVVVQQRTRAPEQ